MLLQPAEEGNEYNYRIHTIYSEFNSAAWLVNLGVFTPAGPITPVPVDVEPTKRDDVARSAQPFHWSDIGMI